MEIQFYNEMLETKLNIDETYSDNILIYIDSEDSSISHYFTPKQFDKFIDACIFMRQHKNKIGKYSKNIQSLEDVLNLKKQ